LNLSSSSSCGNNRKDASEAAVAKAAAIAAAAAWLLRQLSQFQREISSRKVLLPPTTINSFFLSFIQHS
jgi:hypothetical protein